MRTGRTLIVLFVALCLAGSGLIAWQLLRPDPHTLHARLWRSLLAKHGRETLSLELARLTHHASEHDEAGPCLRYQTSVGFSKTRHRRLAALLLYGGLSARLGPRLPRLVQTWRARHEAHFHRESRAAERVALMLRLTHGFDRFVLKLNRERVVAALEARWRQSRGWRVHIGARAARAADVQALRRLWEKHKTLMTAAYELSVKIPGRDQRTGQRMGKVIDLLKAWVERYGRPPADLGDLPINSELRMDAFGMPFDYEIDWEMVRLISPGFDGRRGTRDDQVRGFSWR